MSIAKKVQVGPFVPPATGFQGPSGYPFNFIIGPYEGVNMNSRFVSMNFFGGGIAQL